MKILEHKQRTEEWFAARRGKITGSIVGNFFKSTRQDWIYKLVAERLLTHAEDENARARGVLLEPEALEAFVEHTNLGVEEVGLCVSDDLPYMAVSPDGLIMGDDGKYSEAVEIKCLSGYKQVKAFFDGTYPQEYHAQVVQYFLINQDLKKLYFVMYHDDMPDKLKLLIFEVKRGQVLEDMQAQKELLLDVNNKVEEMLAKIYE